MSPGLPLQGSSNLPDLFICDFLQNDIEQNVRLNHLSGSGISACKVSHCRITTPYPYTCKIFKLSCTIGFSYMFVFIAGAINFLHLHAITVSCQHIVPLCRGRLSRSRWRLPVRSLRYPLSLPETHAPRYTQNYGQTCLQDTYFPSAFQT